MTGIVVEDSAFLHIVISLGILLFTAKVFAEIFHRLKLPVVLGELLAGIIVGPFALGAFISFDGKPIVNLDETVRHIGELSAIVILFIAGLEITPREFLKGGVASFTVGSIGVIVPFFVGYFTFTMFGIHALAINAYRYCIDGNQHCHINSGINRIRKNAIKRSETNLRCCYC